MRSGRRADDAGERLAAVAPLFRDAHGALRDLYGLLARAPERLDQPVQLAVVGQIKRGKSTLVNALLGRRLAVTKEEEATYRVNEFRYTDEAELIEAYYPDEVAGGFLVRQFPVDSLGELTVYDPDRLRELRDPVRIVVRVRGERLRRLTLVDTPGLHSVHGAGSDETQRLITHRSAAEMVSADAMLYLFDRGVVGAPDIDVVHQFLGPESSVRLANAAKALGVLSRCDRNWNSGAASDPLTAGAEQVQSMYHEPELRRTFYDILPVAAIVAEGAQCLSVADLAALRSLADWPPERLLGALRWPANFQTKLAGCPIPPEQCIALKDQLGSWGLLKAFQFMRDGADNCTVIRNLVEVSGVARAAEMIGSLYEHQRYVIKVDGLLHQVRQIMEMGGHAGFPPAKSLHAVYELRNLVEDIADNQDGLAEMRITRLIHQRQLEFDPDDIDRIARLAETHRTVADRLDLAADSDVTELLAAAKAEVWHWRDLRYAARSKETREAALRAAEVAENVAVVLATVIRLRGESDELLRRAAALMARDHFDEEAGAMIIPGRDRQKIRRIAEQLAQRAVAIAGGAMPPEGQDATESLATIDAALSALSEAQENSAREVQRLAAATSRGAQATRVPANSALILAELRDRLRTMTAEDTAGGISAGTLPWAVARLDEALAGLEVAEFADVGAVNVQRHQIVDRRQADAAHPAGTIARSVRSGLTLTGALLRPQQVVVYADGDDGADA